MSAAPKVGDWAVIYEGGYEALEVVKVTPQITVTKSRWGGSHTNHRRTATLLFAGPENIAKRLSEQLKTSRALSDEEMTKSSARHRERTAALVQKAANLSASASQTADDASGMTPKTVEENP